MENVKTPLPSPESPLNGHFGRDMTVLVPLFLDTVRVPVGRQSRSLAFYFFIFFYLLGAAPFQNNFPLPLCFIHV